MISDKFLSLVQRKLPFELTEVQQDVVRRIGTFLFHGGERQAYMLRGFAGTGKTFMVSAIVRVLRVAVVSTVSISLTAKEGQPSAEDDLTGVFPCKIEIKSPSKYIPKALHLDVFGRATGRVDLTDKADYFLVDSLKNSRTAIYSFEEKVLVMCVPGMTSGYDVYNRLMSKISKRYVAYHHSDDYPRYYDDIKYFRLYSVGN